MSRDIHIPREVLFAPDDAQKNPQLAVLKQYFPGCLDKNGAFLPEKLAETLHGKRLGQASRILKQRATLNNGGER